MHAVIEMQHECRQRTDSQGVSSITNLMHKHIPIQIHIQIHIHIRIQIQIRIHAHVDESWPT